jgi:hypothetical protein
VNFAGIWGDFGGTLPYQPGRSIPEHHNRQQTWWYWR